MNAEQFLYCETPDSWLSSVVDNLDLLLIDHANCEKKAASTPLGLMHRYTERSDMIVKLSRVAREELRHFEQVLGIMGKRNIEYRRLSPSRYAERLRSDLRTHEPARLVDTLIVSGIIEARSCERFGRLLEVLDDELTDFYASLLKSESRHFNLYIALAEKAAGESIAERVEVFLKQDQRLVTEPDEHFRFHSGPVG